MDLRSFLGEPVGQTWLQLSELGLAFILSALIGLEREFRQKSAGLRTYTIVGLASALIVLVSKYGFTNILEQNRVVLDPSRVAAQIVSGIGFIGGGVIFVRKDLVRGLTTAATIWVVAAVGMACGAGLPILAIAATIGHFIIVGVFPAVERRLPKSRWTPSQLRISYQGRQGVLRAVLSICTEQDFAVSRVQVEGYQPRGRKSSGPQQSKGHDKQWDDEASSFEEVLSDTREDKAVVSLLIEVRGTKSIPKLAAKIGEIPGVVSVQAGDANLVGD
jgi:putative Mg2+ transporter-C (MgtC) family protein